MTVDTFTSTERSEIMRRVRSKDTRPEIIVGKLIKKMGVKYRRHVGNLPGKPDFVVPKQRKAIFVHGCFWHGHDCEAGKLPKSNRPYWKQKQMNNFLRDSKSLCALRSKGWKPMVLWECEIPKDKELEKKISRFLRQVTS